MFNDLKNKIFFYKITYSDVVYAYKKRNINSTYRDVFFNRLNNGTFNFWNNNILPRVTFKTRVKSILWRYKFFRILILRLYRSIIKHVIRVNLK